MDESGNKKKLEKPWVPTFYKYAFCKINEEPFAVLCCDIGKPDFPVNILLSLEFIKSMRDCSDEDMHSV